MKLSLPISILGIIVTSIITLTTASPKMVCGNHPSDEIVRQIETKFQTNGGIPTTPKVTLNVYFHVISKDNTLEGGNVPDDQIKKQIEVLNQDYAQSTISFKLIATDRTVNPSWFNLVGIMASSQTQMKRTLRKGGPADLNIYTVGSITEKDMEVSGYASFPWEVSKDLAMDGITFLFPSLPGGSMKRYDLGRTATHETGHWLGLYHTFQGGCTPPGDFVDDTPYEATPYDARPWYACANGRNTCPEMPGIDPIYNFMDYSDDVCLFQFTPGQSERMLAALVQFRGVK